ncbi:methyltransferase domain-containing protein [Candidatus Woesearchaeota archaeon]|nr:methyltransferase domain-containing protein [Candidatus Woesearchaeota archaeon]
MKLEKVLVSGSGKLFYVKGLDADYHTQFGMVKKDDLRKAASGDSVKTNTGKELFVLSPGFSDLYRKIRRGPQIVPLKDIAAIIAATGIGRESVVVDAGSGSGALACFLANIVKEVYTYEIRPDFFAIALQNVKELGLGNVKVKNKDAYAGFDEKNVDLVTLDLAEPWKAVGAAADCLNVGGFLASYSPTTPQVTDFVSAVSKEPRLMSLKTIEIIEREWEANDRKVRPKSAAIGHSGFLSFARKISKSE